MKFTCFVLGVRFVVQLLSLSPVLSPTLRSLLYNIEVVFMFSVLFLVFWNNDSFRYNNHASRRISKPSATSIIKPEVASQQVSYRN